MFTHLLMTVLLQLVSHIFTKKTKKQSSDETLLYIFVKIYKTSSNETRMRR